MPNWCANQVDIVGDEAEVARLIELVRGDEEYENEDEDETECVECGKDFESDGNDACEECRSTDEMDEDEDEA